MKTTSTMSKSGSSRKKTSGSKKNLTGSQNKSAQRKSSAKSSNAARKKAGNAKSIEEMNEYQDRLAFEKVMTLLILCVIAIICYLSYLGLAGGIGTVIGGLLFGLFGWIAWLLPIGCLIACVFSIVNEQDRRVPRKIVSAAGIGLLLAAMTDLITEAKVLTEYYQSNHALHGQGAESLYLSLRDTLHFGKGSGGIIGRLISTAFTAVLGKIGAGFVIFALLLLCFYIFYGVELMQHLRKRNAYYQEMEQAYEVIQQEEDYQKPSYRVRVPKNHKRLYTGRTMQTVDLQQMGEQLDQEEERRKQQSVVKKGDAKKNSSEIEEIIPDERKGVKSRKKAEEIRAGYQEQEKAKADPNVKEGNSQLAENHARLQQNDIPIYREEMQQKFGGKKHEKVKDGTTLDTDTVKVEKTAMMLEPSDSPIHRKTGIQKAAAAKSEPIEESMLISAEMAENAASQVVLPEQVDAVNKPMASFAPKEKEVDITPSSNRTKKTVRKSAKSGTVKPVTETDETSGSKSADGKVQKKKVEVQKPKRPYQFPSIDLLSVPGEIPGRISDEELRATALKLQETLRSFNVNVTMGAVTCGPTVTRYELLPEQGVRVNKITNLADDLKLSLAAASIRIEAPIPGKAAVGIEVPNPSSSPVYFRELLEGDSFQKAKSPMTFAVGKDIAGKKIMTDIAKMPHLLIAGATGSGKSVCINTLIMSILYKADPSDVKLIMIDPKVVELSVYNGIPHLFCPVVTDPKEAAASLNWAVREMMERYNKFKEMGVRNISGYNQKIQTVDNAEEAGYTKMASLVIIVDEFADLMMVASKEVEDAVCRLAQLARAAGIHLVLATQRPSVNVITGVIKANIPSRIAFAVSSAIDSRTILDKGGAEKLLGKGDMLFFPAGYSEPVRVQGAFVSDKEVSDVVESLIEANEEPEYNHAVTEIPEEPQEQMEEKNEKKKSDHDEYFEDAGRFVIESERAAAGQLQRRFSIGFNRAGRIIDQLHQAGVVGPPEGTKPRKILMTMEEFEKYLAGGISNAVSIEDMGDPFEEPYQDIPEPGEEVTDPFSEEME